MDILDAKTRVARKDHVCDFCGEIIHKGESYDWQKDVDGGKIYEWKTHKQCSELARKLDDPWCDGITGDDFKRACTDICRDNICPTCTSKDCGKLYCLDKVYEYLCGDNYKKEEFWK